MRFHISSIVTKVYKQFDARWLIIIAIAAFLRFYNISSFATFLGDQGRDALIMQDIVTLKHFPAIGPPTSVGLIYMGPFFYYLIAPFLLIANFNPLGPAIGTALYSLIGLAIVGLMTQRYTNKTTASLCMLALAISSFLTDAAKFAWNPNLLPYFAFATFYFYYEMIVKRNYAAAFLTGLLFGFSLQLHPLVLLTAVGLVLGVFISLLRTKDKKILTLILVAIVGFTLATAPLIIFDLRHNFINTHSLISLFHSNSATKISITLSSFWQTTYKLFYIALPFTNNYNPVVLPTIAYILYQSINRSIREKNRFILMHLCIVMLYILLFTLVKVEKFPHYYGSIILSFYLVLLYPFFNTKCMPCKVGGVIAIAAFVLINAIRFNFLFNTGSNQIKHAQDIARDIAPHIDKGPYQLATIPFTEADEQYRYFLTHEVAFKQLDERSLEQPSELFVLCFEPCRAVDDAQWVIASFKDKHVQEVFTVQNITIYKLVHKRVTIHQ
ncbi:MAG: glycosyltransferase family 39 protein [Candidatus Roizmanbacteria bacterium]|nr:glycosyltransferase family 39 protein [Candidatus Roizmanbacteria bacterium]